jgi:hypothetical protein
MLGASMTRVHLVLAALAVAFLAGVAGCRDTSADIEAAKDFDRFPLYWVGERFEKWDLTHIDGLDYPSQIISFIYGDCTPHDGEQPSCTPPFQIQVSRLCAHLPDVARAPIWRQRRIRGAPVGTIDSAPVLFTRGAQVKVYRGEGSYPGLTMKVLRAFRSINRVPPLISSTGPIAPPRPGVLEGTRACPG